MPINTFFILAVVRKYGENVEAAIPAIMINIKTIISRLKRRRLISNSPVLPRRSKFSWFMEMGTLPKIGEKVIRPE
jgi:hypothetical protein